MKIAVVGASAAGLFVALLAARAGHEVKVVEQERLEPATDVESAAARAYRASAPQIVQPHIVMARCRELLREHLPDVYDELLVAGVAEAPLPTQMPASLADRTARPGDERLTMLATRRSTVDWVLQRQALVEPGVAIRFGTRVRGVSARGGDPPEVCGIRIDDGDIDADLVVDTTGRRSPIDRWLGEIGARPSATWWAECGLAYYSRHYRLRRGADLPGPPTTRAVAGLDELTVGIWGGDNGAMQLVVAPLASDRRFRPLRDPAVFTAVARSVPLYAAWLDAIDPITDVFSMAGLHNTMRRLVVDGVPVVHGLCAIGDSVCTTNPTLGRGLTLALQQAVDLVATLGEAGDRRRQHAVMLDALIGEHIMPFYEDQAIVDGARLALLRHRIFDAPAPDARARRDDRVDYAELRAAAWFDATAFRGFWRMMGMIDRPADVYTDQAVVAATRATLREHPDGPAFAQPTRDQLLAALASSGKPGVPGASG